MTPFMLTLGTGDDWRIHCADFSDRATSLIGCQFTLVRGHRQGLIAKPEGSTHIFLQFSFIFQGLPGRY
jgi:hypothetical protein